MLIWLVSVAMAGPLSEHLHEAIVLNRARRPLYAASTQGRSRPVSRRLIWSERLALLYSPVVDIPARRYKRHGVPLLEDEIVSMSLAPAYQERVLPAPVLEDHVPLPASVVKAELRLALSEEGFDGALIVAERWLTVSGTEPRLDCMTRHMLESIAAISALAPTRAEQAAQAGLKDPSALLGRLLRQHVRLLDMAAALDRKAAPLQAEGVPILCQDVPPIYGVH